MHHVRAAARRAQLLVHRQLLVFLLDHRHLQLQRLRQPRLLDVFVLRHVHVVVLVVGPRPPPAAGPPPSPAATATGAGAGTSGDAGGSAE